MTGNTMNTDPGLFFPKIMVGSRDYQVFPVYGQEKDNGALDYSFMPTNGDIVLANAVGSDAQPSFGVTGTPGGTVNTTLSAGASAGASTITVGSNVGFVAGSTIIQIDSNATGPPIRTAECRLVTLVSGGGPYTITLDLPLTYTHFTGEPVVSVVTPFTHTIKQQAVLNSMTVEKNIGNFQSLQFAGCRVGKWELKGAATDTEAVCTCDITAQSWAILTTPSALTLVDEQPFSFSEFTLTWNGQVFANAGNFTLTLDNGVTPEWTFNATHQAQFIPALYLRVNGSFDAVFDSLNDPNYGLWNDAVNSQTEAQLSFSMTYPTSPQYGVTFVLPKVRLAKDEISPDISKVIMETASFEARRSLSASPSETIHVILVNGQPHPVI